MIKNRYIYTSAYFLVSYFFFSFTPTQENKNRERIDFLKQQIKQTEEILTSIKIDKSNFISQIQTRQGLINHRNELNDRLTKEIETLSLQLKDLQTSNKEGLDKLNVLKKDFARVARQKLLFKISNPNFSSTNLDEWNEILKKLLWTEQLNKYRIKRFIIYKKSQESVLIKQLEIESKIVIQKDLLKTQEEEKNKLSQDFTKLQDDYKIVQEKQKDYLSIIKSYIVERNQLEKLINNSIAIETAKQNINIAKSNTEHHWTFPLKGGTITSRFGTFNDSNNKKLTIKNNGIDIRSSNSFVAAIEDSEVLQIRQLPNGSFFLLTRIGDLYQVYSNLDKVLVKQGEKVIKGDNIGELKSESTGLYELHFEVWQGKIAVDPMNYLGR